MKDLWKRSFALLQQMGKALMLPVSVLPVAGLLLGLGSAKLIDVQRGTNKFFWLPEFLGQIMKQSGDAIFANLPLIFAIAVAIAFTGNDGVSALAATVGFVVFVAALGAASVALQGVDPDNLQTVMGIPSLDTGVFGGLIIGCVAAYLFNRFYRIQLPQYLGFFAGKRFVPIITGLAAILVGIIMSFIWPPVGGFINWAASVAADPDNVPRTAFIYGVVERALLPFGLHHIWNVPFFFEIGSYTDPATGETVSGDITRFFAGDPTAGILGGAYWFKMFGLPAAAIAIWHVAKPKNRKVTSGIMLSAAFTSFLTGITEPIEYSFLFVAPLLYVIHAFIAGLCDFIFAALGGRMGFTFSQGFIDFFLFSGLPNTQKTWLIPVFGLLVAAPLYYFVFRLGIKYFNFKTPGREEDVEEAVPGGGTAPTARTEVARELVRAFGGRNNIASLDACITRLRITVQDMSKVNVARLKTLGASGVLQVGNSAQAIFGPRSENLKTDMVEYLQSAGPEADVVEAPPVAESLVPAAAPGVASPPTVEPDPEAARKAGDMIAALGGRDNIRNADAVALTRLRVEVADSAAVNEESLRRAGVDGILRLPGGKLHLLVGLHAEQYAAELKGQLAQVG